MKAARYYGPGDVRVEQIPEPVAKEGQLKVKIAWNGICGSDLHAYLAPVSFYPTLTEPNNITGETLPTTLGHEFSGTIVELGEGVDKSKWAVGKNVVIEPLISCLKLDSCIGCAAGARNLCPSANFIGIGGWGGGLAEYIAVDTRYVHLLPEGVPLEVGAMIEPLAVAYYAIKISGFKKGQTALVVGGGPIGLFLLKVLRSIDPTTTILLSEPAKLRREFALQHGATQALDPTNKERTVPESVYAATGGIGVDVAFDAAGIQASIDAALNSVRPQGTFVNVAIWEEDARINMNLLVVKELKVLATLGYSRIHPELLELVAAGKIAGLEGLITSKIGIEDVVAKGFLSLLHEKDTQVKILVHP